MWLQAIAGFLLKNGKFTLVITVFTLVAGLVGFVWHKINSLEQELAQKELSLTQTIQINEDISARLASEYLLKDSLQGALEAEKALRADLVAAAVLELQPDTVYKDSVRTETVVESDSVTRNATVVDTTEAGVLHAYITAPPCCADLQFRYSFNPAPINPTVSLLRTEKNQAIFAVTYRGGTSTITAPYANLNLPRPFLVPYVGIDVEPFRNNISIYGGAKAHLFKGLYVTGVLSDFVEKDYQQLSIRFGVMKEF